MKCDEVGNFPIDTFKTDDFNPSEFEWEIGYATTMQYEKLDNLTKSEIDKLINKGYREDIIIQGQVSQKMYWKAYDYV